MFMVKDNICHFKICSHEEGVLDLEQKLSKILRSLLP